MKKENAPSAPEVLLVGDVMMDYQYWIEAMPRAGGDVAILSAARNPGGSAANTAIALAAQGVRCSFHGRVGRDEIGDALVAQLRAAGLNLSCLQLGGDSGYTVTMIDAGGERTMFSYRNLAGYRPAVDDALLHALGQIRILFLSGYMLAEPHQAAFVLKLAGLARQKGCRVMLDVPPVIGRVEPAVVDAVLPLTDVLLPNRRELLELAGADSVQEGIAALLGRVPCIGLKLGAGGAMLAARAGFALINGQALVRETRCTAPAANVKVVDTTGAGDSFNAGFVLAYLRAAPPAEWIREGNRLAGLAISHKGATAAYR